MAKRLNDNHEHREVLREFATSDLGGQIIQLANRHFTLMQGMNEKDAFSCVKSAVDDAVIAFGVYQDPTSPIGVGLHVIKGARELQVIIASDSAQAMAYTAISIDLEQAIAAEWRLGDGRLPTPN